MTNLVHMRLLVRIEFTLYLQERLQFENAVLQIFGLLDAEADVLADQTTRECEKFIRVAFLDVEEWNSPLLDLEERISFERRSSKTSLPRFLGFPATVGAKIAETVVANNWS